MIKLILLVLLCAGAYAYNNFHGCALTKDKENISGWVVTLDTMIILKTTNGGASWQEQPQSATRRFFDITCVDALHAWTCGILGEITWTTDRGNTWQLYPAGGAKYATRIEFIDTSFGWSACGDGVIKRTTNGGNYWETNYTQFFLAEFYGVSFVNQLDGWMVAGWPDTLEYGQGYIMRSRDGGILWDSLFRSANYDEYLDVYFFNLLDGIVVGGNDSSLSAIILKTMDGGASWSSIAAPVNAYYLRAVDFADDLDGWAVGRFGTIIHTSDGGNTWAFQANPSHRTLFDVDFCDNLHGLACGYGMILYTTDGGQNWNIGNRGIEERTGFREQETGLTVYPNPFRDKVSIVLSAKRKGQNTLCTMPSAPCIKIYDAAGRLVKSFNLSTPPRFLADCSLLATSVTWHGDDDSGRNLPPGVYFIRLDTGDMTLEQKVIQLE